MNVKKLLCLFLSLLMLASTLVACKGDEEGAPNLPTDAFPLVYENAAVCKIVYASGGNILRTLADDLATAIERATGVRPETGKAEETEETEYEILLGKTGREASNTVYGSFKKGKTEMKIQVSGTKLVFAGSTLDELDVAVTTFIQYYGLLGATAEEGKFTVPLTLNHVSDLTDLPVPGDNLSNTSVVALSAASYGAFQKLEDCGNPVAACSDGTNVFVLCNTGKSSRIAKITSAGKVEATSGALELGSITSMCYNPRICALIITNGTRDVAIVDANTFTVKQSVKLKLDVKSVTYDYPTNTYVFEQANSLFKYFTTDGSFDTAAEFQGVTQKGYSKATSVTSHGIACDDKYIYVLQSATVNNRVENYIVGYDWDFLQRFIRDVPVAEGKTAAETFGIFHLGGLLQVGVKDGEGGYLSAITATVTNPTEPYKNYSKNSVTSGSALLNAFTVAGPNGSNQTNGTNPKSLATQESSKQYHTVMQGGCSDGKRYIYICMEYQGKYEFPSGTAWDTYYEASETHTTRIVKIDTTTKRAVAISKPLALGHSNDATYNTRTDQIIVCYSGNNGKLIKVVDAATLTLVETITVSKGASGIGYNEQTGMYMLTSGTGMNIFDSDMVNVVQYKPFVNPAIQTYGDEKKYNDLTQGTDCDSKYIYFIRSAKRLSDNKWFDYIVVYDWDGNVVTWKNISGPTLEGEFICHIGSTVYLGCNGDNDPLYKLTFN